MILDHFDESGRSNKELAARVNLNKNWLWETKEVVAFGVSLGHLQYMTAVAHTSGVKSVLSFLSFSEVV